MHNFVFRHIAKLRQNYWFWPSAMTLGAVILGFFLPYLDSRVGSDWIRSVGFKRECTTQEISVTTARRDLPNAENEQVISADAAGFLQQVDLQSLTAVAREEDIQIILHRAPGDFLVVGETVMVLLSARQDDLALAMRVRDCYTQGANRTDVQDILFLSDQLVEVLGRAFPPASMIRIRPCFASTGCAPDLSSSHADRLSDRRGVTIRSSIDG
jgi:uncharacterized membrane protein